MAVDGLKPFSIDRFGGLNLAADPSELGFSGAVDLMNVTVDPGVIRQRDGFATHIAATSAPMSTLHSAHPYLLVGVGDDVRQYLASSVSSTTSFTDGGPYGFVNFGTPVSGYTFVGNGHEPVHRLSGTSWNDGSTDATLDGVVAQSMPKGALLAVTPWDNRLVVTGFAEDLTGGGPGGGGNTSSVSHVWFSDPGDPTSWSANNYVILRPGDGEHITAIAAWQNYLFVFKETAFFVFYGTSTSGAGTPVFDYRAVTGTGHAGGLFDFLGQDIASPHSVGVTRDGVYFANENGVFRTTGGPPVEVSQAIRPLFRQGSTNRHALADSSPLLTTTVDAFSYARAMAWDNERLYISYEATGGSNPATLVYDPQQDTWTIWDCAPPGFAVHPRNDIPVLMFTGEDIGSSTDWNVYYVNPEATTDQGVTSISSWYQSGFSDLGAPAVEKTIRETQVIGSGTLSLGWPRELSGASNSPSLTLGETDLRYRGLIRKAFVGELLSFRVSSSSPWRLNRIVPMLRESRGVGERTHA